MKTLKRNFYMLSVILAFLVASIIRATKSRAQTAIVQVTVNSGIVSIGSNGTLNVWAITTSNATGSLSGQYPANSFWIQDLKGWTGGYTTTVQSTALTGLVQGVVQTIAATNIYMKAWGAPTLMSWYANTNTIISVGITSGSYTAISSAQTYISKNTTGLTWGIYSTYGDAPWVRVDVPPFQTATAYQATITFTLTAS